MGKLRGISSKKNHSILAMPTYSRTKDTYLAALLLLMKSTFIVTNFVHAAIQSTNLN